MNPRLQELANILRIIEDYRPRIEWISHLHIRHHSIAHFGCNVGYESLALAMVLRTQEIVGLDKDEGAIQQAQSWIRNAHDLVNHIHLYLQYSRDLSDDIRAQLQIFVREYEERVRVHFVAGDMTKETPLTSSTFDLAYCERVLYHIACDTSEYASANVLAAIREMVRVIKSDGHIIAIEPQSCKLDGPLVNLASFFEQAGLLSIPIDGGISLPENKSVYFYGHGL